jgi:hypothetical protein
MNLHNFGLFRFTINAPLKTAQSREGVSYQVMGTWIYCWFYEGKGTLGKGYPVLYYLMS